MCAAELKDCFYLSFISVLCQLCGRCETSKKREVFTSGWKRA